MTYKPMSILVRSALIGATLVSTLFSNGSFAQEDQREVIALDNESRAFIVQEMHQYVSGLQQALIALSKDDGKGVASAIRPLGMQGMAKAPAALMKAIPDGFKQIGMPIHMAFDKIADAAEKGAATSEILSGLGMAMNRCIACHSAYRIESKP